jgi:hypothetical protein
MTPEQAEALIAKVQANYVGYRPKWSVLYDNLLIDDEEALAFVREWTDPKKIAARKRKAKSEKVKEEREARYESQAVDPDDASYSGRSAIERVARGREVWLYHGTTSKFLRAILVDGLIAGVHRIDAKQRGVYLTARHTPSAVWYADRAAGHFGGDPVVLRVRVPFDWLEWDADDEDISAGNYQFIADRVPPERICEVNGKKIKGRCEP